MELVHRSICNLERMLPHWRRDPLLNAMPRPLNPDGYLGATE
jgi:hypothetical protein